MKKKFVLVMEQFRALVVLITDLNSLSEFGDEEFESSLFERNLDLLMARGGTFF